MSDVVALVCKIDPEQEAAYLSALAAAMPDETLVRFRDLSPAQRAAAAIAVVANPDPADVAALPNLAWVQSLWAGVERLMAELGAGAPPVVRLVDPELARTMAEAVLAWTYYLQRDMPAYAAQQREETWRQRDYRKPSGMTVGLLGLGALGTVAAERLGQAGFRVLGWSRSAKALPGVETVAGEEGLAAVLGRSDIVVCLLPLTARTRGLLNGARLAAMKPGAALINFARGPIVVARDLLEALDGGRLSHAVLDVFDEEPLPPGSPFWRHPRVTVLPHISAPTDLDTAAAVVAANIRAYRRTGRPPRSVDVARGY
ncbi:Glyoxylate/hydroxypyruvate reductase A [Methylobacterium crusticola]|uniref:Glyoxylate/hydroxypyruvate reductase A n=1 Tax=Methylobacterium crusticola TaxID=1697972 RepID=A0ABQ4QVI3_9HYPH|nr:glyoxylate/hydroxypyruvate reductase A [Methylobacterium crusticola]GJD49343.1 Glyoxylate/hydroxypyruvate reductase A [Methylobacterium crusticola]